jgi:hypothetical protein
MALKSPRRFPGMIILPGASAGIYGGLRLNSNPITVR